LPCWPAAPAAARAWLSLYSPAAPAHGSTHRAHESAPTRRKQPCPGCARGESASSAPGTRRVRGRGGRPATRESRGSHRREGRIRAEAVLYAAWFTLKLGGRGSV